MLQHVVLNVASHPAALLIGNKSASRRDDTPQKMAPAGALPI